MQPFNDIFQQHALGTASGPEYARDRAEEGRQCSGPREIAFEQSWGVCALLMAVTLSLASTLLGFL